MSKPPADEGPLAHCPGGQLRVLDLSSGIAGGYCTKLLADAGADVVKVEPPGGEALRAWSTTGGPLDGDGPLFSYLSASKRSITGSVRDREVLRLAGLADLVVETIGRPELDRSGLLDLARTVIVSISAYGRSGPWADRPATEFIVQAESGCIAARGLPGKEPFSCGGRIFEWVGGAYAATAGLAAVMGARRTGRGEHVDLSLLEGACIASFAAFTALAAELEGVDLDPDDINTISSRAETPSIEPTADGWVGFTTNSRQQFDDFLLLIERGDLLDEARFYDARQRWANFDEWNTLVRAWTSQHPTQEIVDTAAALRIPVAPVADAAEVGRSPHFAARGVFRPNPNGFDQPRRPYRIDFAEPSGPGLVPAPGEHDGEIDWAERAVEQGAVATLPLSDLRVLDLTAWVAGPLGSQVFSLLGAEVVHVESISRLDGMRMTGGTYARRFERWWECSSQFLMINAGKEGITLDLATDTGRQLLARLIGWADVVIENFTPRVMEKFGLGWEELRALNPRVLMVRMPAFGLDGPWRDWTGFAQTMEQVTGLAWITGHVDDQPRIQRGPSDIVSGLHGVFATLVAMHQREATGRGAHLEVPMVESTLNVAAEALVEFDAFGNVMGRSGNRAPWAAPQGLYLCQDGAWLAVSVETDAHFEALADVVCPRWRDNPDLSTHAGRTRREGELDATLSSWATERLGADAVETLVSAGVPAGRVRDQRRSPSHPQLVARRFYERIDHPVVGPIDVVGPPFRYASVERWVSSPAPTVGQHNTQVLGGILGLSEGELAELATSGVIGDRPVLR